MTGPPSSCWRNLHTTMHPVQPQECHPSLPSKRLSEKNLGPYEIISAPGSHSFTIRLPPQFRTVHLVFHVSQLKLAVPNPFPNHFQPPPPPIETNGEPEYEVSKILDLKTDQ